MQDKAHVDKGIVEQMQQEMKYWTEILKRILSVIRFLSERGLAFRGDTEVIGSPNNGNYLGSLELIAEYDPFLKQHLDMYANKGQGKVSYLSKTICEEFITLMGNKILNCIKSEMKEAKYWGIIVDSTPDLSHVDQLSIVFRYYFNGCVYERFFCFTPIESHTGKSLSSEVLEILKENDLNITDCRAQSYDNASNMSGKYEGLQAYLKAENRLAHYVPCVGHSLNLVGENSVNKCVHARNFFSLVQRFYAFFSASTHRWSVLTSQNKIKLKSLSSTRWSSRADATKEIVENFDNIYHALSHLAQDINEKLDTRDEAASLLNKIINLENAFMSVFWHRVLDRFNAVNKYIQKVNLDLNTANDMLLSLLEFVKNVRDDFFGIEKQAKELSKFVNQEYSDLSKRKIIKKFSDGEVQTSSHRGSDKFKIEVFYVMVDYLINELQKRSEAYSYIVTTFSFLSNLTTLSKENVQKNAKILLDVYSEDLDSNILNELEHFVPLLKNQTKIFVSNYDEKCNDKQILNPLKVLNWMFDCELIDTFPNIYIAYKLFVTIPVANCEAERSFSVLARIKNLHRSTMSHGRLSSLTRLCIENDLLRSLDFEDLIQDFANLKCRKKVFL